MWDIFFEEQIITLPEMGKEFRINVKGVRRNEGLSLQAISINPEGFETFLLRGEFGEVKFYAERGDDSIPELKDKYIIYINMFNSSWGQDNKVAEEIIKKYSKEIEDALLNFPIDTRFHTRPPEQILFKTNDSTTSAILVRAEDV